MGDLAKVLKKQSVRTKEKVSYFPHFFSSETDSLNNRNTAQCSV